MVPPTAGVKLSLVVTSPKKPTSRFYGLENTFSAIPNFANYSLREAEKEPRTSHETGSSDGGSQPNSNGQSGKAPAFGADNTLLSATTSSKDTSKRKKPKTNMAKTNSSYVSRVVSHEALSKRLQERNPDGIYAFANINRAFQWLDLTSTPVFGAENLTKILFTKAHMLCHDVNVLTKAANHLDLIIGSSAADIMWYEPFSQRYNRINKNGMINASPVSDIRWIPGSENLFLASHMDGTLIVYDKDRDDAVFVPEEATQSASGTDGDRLDSTSLQIHKSVNSKNQKANPVASWKISNQKINSFAFSPDSRHLAVVSEDGSLRIIDYLNET